MIRILLWGAGGPLNASVCRCFLINTGEQSPIVSKRRQVCLQRQWEQKANVLTSLWSPGARAAVAAWEVEFYIFIPLKTWDLKDAHGKVKFLISWKILAQKDLHTWVICSYDETRVSLCKRRVLKYICGNSGPVRSSLLVNFTEINSTWHSISKGSMRGWENQKTLKV